MNRKKSPCVSDCHARSLRGCKSILLFFCILRAKRGCCGVIVVGKGNVASIGSVATPGRNACWGVPQTPKKRGETMTNRTRKIVLRVPVTPEEQELIRQKMALLHTRNFSAYARKMLIDGYTYRSTKDIDVQIVIDFYNLIISLSDQKKKILFDNIYGRLSTIPVQSDDELPF